MATRTKGMKRKAGGAPSSRPRPVGNYPIKILCVSGLVGQQRQTALAACCSAWRDLGNGDLQRNFKDLFVSEYEKKYGKKPKPAWTRIIGRWPEQEIRLARAAVLQLCEDGVLDEPTVQKARGQSRLRLDVRVRRKKAELIMTFYHPSWT